MTYDGEVFLVKGQPRSKTPQRKTYTCAHTDTRGIELLKYIMKVIAAYNCNKTPQVTPVRGQNDPSENNTTEVKITNGHY